MRGILVTAGLAAVLAAGCHDLPDLGTCGNGVIEADNGEACDGDTGGEHSCSTTCELLCLDHAADGYVVVSPANATEEYCPDSRMSCGLDGVCRAPSGQFVEVGSAQRFDVKQAVSGDFDGDGITDLVGTSATEIVVRLGASTPFVDGFVQASPSADSPIAIFDRDPDGIKIQPSSLALAVPTDGLALLTSDTEVFGPDLDLTFAVDDTTQVQFVATDPDPALQGSDAVFAVAKQGTLAVNRIDIAGPHTQLALPTCGPAGSKLIGLTVARDGKSFVIVGKPLAAGGFFLCRYTPNGNVFQMAQSNVVGPPPDSVVLAQVDNEACPDLVLGRATPPLTVFAFIPAIAGTCAFPTNIVAVTSLGTTPSIDTIFDAGSIVAGGGVERDEVISTSGVYQIIDSPTPTIVLAIGPTSDINPWTTAAVVDLNGDGQLDVVAGRKGQDDVDVVRGGVVPNAYRADTVAPIVATVAGDFDGDFLGDVALIEQGPMIQRVSILYGQRDGIVATPIVNSPFGGQLKIGRLRRATWGLSARGADGIDDLVITRAAMGLPTIGGVLVGDAARLMTTLRIPPPATPGDPPVSIGVVAVGKLTGTADLFAGALRVGSRVTSDGNSKLALNNIATAEWSPAVTVVGFEVDTLHPASIIRTASTPLIGAFAKPAGSPMTKFGIVAHDGKVCTGTLTGAQFNLHSADVVGDDEIDELVVSVDNGKSAHVFPITAGAPCTIGAEILTTALAASGMDGACSDVVKAGDQTVALCPHGLHRYGLFRISNDARDVNPFAVIDGIGLRLITGDFDGDGVVDLAVGVGRAAEISVVFLKQCPSHDVRGCN